MNSRGDGHNVVIAFVVEPVVILLMGILKAKRRVKFKLVSLLFFVVIQKFAYYLIEEAQWFVNYLILNYFVTFSLQKIS